MRTAIGSLILVLAVSFSVGPSLAADPMKEKEASPIYGRTPHQGCD